MIDSYKKLTLEKWQELRAIDYMSMEEIDIQVNMIAILNDMDENEVLDLSIPEYKKLAQGTVFLTKEPVLNKRLPNKFKINGNEYTLLKDVRDMTAGQYIDYQTYLSFNDIDKYIGDILTCFIIPSGKKYGDYDLEAAKADIMQLSVEEALSIAGFFMKQSRSLTRATLIFLDWKMKRAMRKMKDETMKKKMEEARKAIRTLHNTIKNGDGFPQ